jgi:hypothetical protein
VAVKATRTGTPTARSATAASAGHPGQTLGVLTGRARARACLARHTLQREDVFATLSTFTLQAAEERRRVGSSSSTAATSADGSRRCPARHLRDLLRAGALRARIHGWRDRSIAPRSEGKLDLASEPGRAVALRALGGHASSTELNRAARTKWSLRSGDPAVCSAPSSGGIGWLNQAANGAAVR